MKAEDDFDHLYEALKAAKKAFEEYFKSEGLDSAYWELEPLVGHVLNEHDFQRWGRIVYDYYENKIRGEVDEG